MEESITWVGIDAHKKTLAVAVLAPGDKPTELTIENNERAIRRLVRRVERAARGREIRFCYEAGTCGYALQRRIEAAGSAVCEVIAPSLIPRKPGERIKTDRRDALKLAELNRAGVLTVVSPPTPEQEAVRDLCRCREDVRADLARCRHRLVKMLVRRGFVFDTSKRLTSALFHERPAIPHPPAPRAAVLPPARCALGGRTRAAPAALGHVVAARADDAV